MKLNFDGTLLLLPRLSLKGNGLTPHNTVIHAKLQLGMELLLKKYSVKEAAAAAGFNSASYFSRIFKKYYGLPPGNMI